MTSQNGPADNLEDFLDFLGLTSPEEATQNGGFFPSAGPVPDQPAEDSEVSFETNQKLLNFQGDSVADILNLTNTNEALVKHDLAVKHFEIDRDLYADIYDQSPVIQQAVSQGVHEYKPFDTLNEDMFMSLFKYKPEVRPVEDMKKSAQFNHEMMKRLTETPDYRRLRQSCKLDALASAMGTEVVGQRAMEIILNEKERRRQQKAKQKGQKGQPGQKGQKGQSGQQDPFEQGDPFETVNALVQAEQNIEDLQENIDNLEDIIEEMQNQANTDPEQLKAMENRLTQGQMDLQTAQKIAEELGNELDDILEDDLGEQIMDDIVSQVSNAFKQADEEVSEIRELIDQWGMNPGETIRVSLDDKRQALERIRRSKKLKEMSDLIGRFVQSAIKDQKQKTKDGATSIKSVKTGNRIESILPSEMMKLANPVTKTDFYRRYNQKELLIYELESTNKKKKGPMIVCVDVSGSMQGPREKWSKAIAIALLEIAQIQKRDYACILFESSVTDVIIIEKDELSPNKIVDIAEKFRGGGTNFEAPLRESMKLITDSRFKKADITFITDGDCSVGETFLKEFKRTKDEKEFVCRSILVDAGGGSVSDRTLEVFSDEVIRVSNLADLTNDDSESAHQIFNGV